MPIEVTTWAIKCRLSASSAGDRRRRPAEEGHRPGAVDHRDRGIQADPAEWHIQTSAVQPAAPCHVEDQQRGHDDQHAFNDGGEQFRLIVAVWMVGVGRTGGDAQRGLGIQTGSDIYDALHASEHSAALPVSYQATPFMLSTDSRRPFCQGRSVPRMSCDGRVAHRHAPVSQWRFSNGAILRSAVLVPDMPVALGSRATAAERTWPAPRPRRW